MKFHEAQEEIPDIELTHLPTHNGRRMNDVFHLIYRMLRFGLTDYEKYFTPLD